MTREALPNSPLAEVVYEIRFPGNLSLLSTWGSLQADLRGRFPKLFVSRATPGEAPLLQPLRLVSDDEQRLVLLSINTFAYCSKKYDTFADFRRGFEFVFDEFRRRVTVSSITRLGLRYVNVLPPTFGPPRERDRLHPCLKLCLAGWEGLPNLGEGSTELVFHSRDGDKHLRLGLLDAGQIGSSPEAVVGPKLDFDCYTTAADSSRVFPFLESAHETIESAFFAIITPEYHRYLKGEP